jgi:TRAP-type C4-dicarboxylate transport system permease large subunit
VECLVAGMALTTSICSLITRSSSCYFRLALTKVPQAVCTVSRHLTTRQWLRLSVISFIPVYMAW